MGCHSGHPATLISTLHYRVQQERFKTAPLANRWLATAFEIARPIGLILGFGTRFFSFALMVLTAVAISVAHWPAEWHTLSYLLAGYAISDQVHGNFKLPVLYLAMLMPLWLGGTGRWSLGFWLRTRKQRCEQRQPMATLSSCGSGNRLVG